jgi:8-amino-7-oxononanoate synthase
MVFLELITDYLSIAQSQQVQSKINLTINGLPSFGSSGSRLLTGNSKECMELEEYLAHHHNAEAALLFNSGYSLNLSIFGCISTSENDFFLVDEFVHASILQGIKLGKSKNLIVFKHNDLVDFRLKLKKIIAPECNIFVAVEGIYSMDGTVCKLDKFYEIAQHYSNVEFIIDEAHSNGILGFEGRGLVSLLNLEKQIFARIHTFGKAIGCHGAVLLGSAVLKDYLLNYGKPLIFSTFMPLHNVIAIKCCYEYMIEHHDMVKLY